MMKFEDIWKDFSWVVDELNSGMAFFEGYIPSVRFSNIESPLQEFARLECVKHYCEPCWNHESDIPDSEQDYSISECVNLLLHQKLASFDFEYERDHGWVISNQKLMFMPEGAETEVVIICFADWIIGSNKPKETIEIAIAEMRYFKERFNSDALHIGPDGLDLSVQNGLQID